MARKNQSGDASYDDMMRALNEVGFVRTLPIFAMHTPMNGGLLPDRKEAHACWYYCRVAHMQLDKVADGGIYEGDVDPTNNLYELAKAVAAFYKLDSPDEMLKHMGDCILEAIRCKMEWNPGVEEPLKALFRKGDGQTRIIN